MRFLGHAGSDVELGTARAPRSCADYARDPLLATATHLVRHAILDAEQVVERYEATRAAVMRRAAQVVGEPRLADRAAVVRPLAGGSGSPRRGKRGALRTVGAPPGRGLGSRAPGDPGPADPRTGDQRGADRPAGRAPPGDRVRRGRRGQGWRLRRDPGARKRFGGRRVFDTLLDEQTILGTALGTSLAGLLPLPEIQYLAYLHNAEDQLRGEAASLAFFSDGSYRNPMVVRIAGLAYQRASADTSTTTTRSRSCATSPG